MPTGDQIESLAAQMEQALSNEHMDRFKELAKKRGKLLQDLSMMKKTFTKPPDGSAGFDPAKIEEILKKAVAHNSRMINVARQKLEETRDKINKLAARKKDSLVMEHRYENTRQPGTFFLAKG